MKILLLVSLLYFPGTYATLDEKDKVAQALQKFTIAVVEADESKFSALFSGDLVFGNSKGGIQDKKSFIAEIVPLDLFDYLTNAVKFDVDDGRDPKK